MPLQWLNLDQSIYRKPQQRSPVSQALRTRPMQGGSGFAAAGGNLPNTFVEQQKAKWAEEDKMKKLERDAQTQKAQEMGMRIQNAYKEEQARGRQMSAQASQQRTLAQAQQQGAAKQKIEDNPEPAAEEMYNLILSMPDETQNTLLNQLFTPTSTGGTISSAGKTIKTEPKYNAIAGVFLSKGWATIDKAGKAVLSEPEREFEKGTFESTDQGILNTATGKIMVKNKDIPEGFTAKEIADGLNYGRLYMGSLTEPTLLEKITPEKMAAFMDNAREESRKATENYLYALGRGRGLTRKQAHDIAYGLSDEDLGGGKGGTTGRQKPLDEDVAKDLAAHLKITPDADIEAYRDEYGDATVNKALELNKEPEPTPEPTPKPKFKPEPIIKEEKKIKDYFGASKYSPL